MSKTGARRGNLNAGRHGLYSLRPYIRVTVAHTITVAELGTLAMTLADGALWISGALAEALMPPEERRAEMPELDPMLNSVAITKLALLPELPDGGKTNPDAWLVLDGDLYARSAIVSKGIGLYASVAHELLQLAGELGGVTGIKPAALGQLGEAEFDVMMRSQAKALGLILSQCRSTWQSIKDHEGIEGDGLIIRGEINPVLEYLAAHMRSAKRAMREMAANQAWRQADVYQGENLADRIRAVIPTREG